MLALIGWNPAALLDPDAAKGHLIPSAMRRAFLRTLRPELQRMPAARTAEA